MLQICYKKPKLVIIYKKRKKDYERKNKENFNKLWNNSNVKIWSDKK